MTIREFLDKVNAWLERVAAKAAAGGWAKWLVLAAIILLVLIAIQTIALANAPYYLLRVTAPAPPTEWRINGGWDSCLLIRQMLLRYAPEAQAECAPMNHDVSKWVR